MAKTFADGIIGNWLLLGCYLRIDGKWELDRDYFYAAYYELWEFDETVMTINGLDISTHYPYRIATDRITCPAYALFPDGEPREHTFIVRFIDRRLYLVQLDYDAETLNRIYVFEPTLWSPNLEAEQQLPAVKKQIKNLPKIHWLQKEELEKAARLELPLQRKDLTPLNLCKNAL